MKTQNEVRTQWFAKLLDFLQTHLNGDTFTQVDPQAIAEELGLLTHIVKKGLMLLNHELKAIENSKRGHYRAKPALFEVTGGMLDKALLEYQRQHSDHEEKQEIVGPAEEVLTGIQLEIPSGGQVLTLEESRFMGQQLSAKMLGAKTPIAEMVASTTQVYGFELEGQVVWFSDKVEAAKEALKVAVKHDLEQITMVQKSGVLLNTPTVTYFT
jgi:hypothetical protein